MSRSRWIEAALTVISGAAVLFLLTGPAEVRRNDLWFVVLIAVPLLASTVLIWWQYRIMDEFRRARSLKAWAAGGLAGFMVLTALIVWGVAQPVRTSGQGRTSVKITFELWTVYLPWLAIIATSSVVTAVLYFRDQRS